MRNRSRIENRTIQILLIEDDPSDARLLTELLIGEGVNPVDVRTANRLGDALVFLSNGNTDIVLLDLNLPDSSGLDTFLTAQRHSPDIPIIVLSGYGDEGFARKAVQQGAQDYLKKSQVDGRTILRAIDYADPRSA